MKATGYCKCILLPPRWFCFICTMSLVLTVVHANKWWWWWWWWWWITMTTMIRSDHSFLSLHYYGRFEEDTPYCPNSIRSILSETRSPTCRRPGRRQVADQVRDFFICRKLVARSISTCRDRSILSETRSPTFLVSDLSATRRRPA